MAKYCIYCGKELSLTANFCVGCGAKIQRTESQPQAPQPAAQQTQAQDQSAPASRLRPETQVQVQSAPAPQPAAQQTQAQDQSAPASQLRPETHPQAQPAYSQVRASVARFALMPQPAAQQTQAPAQPAPAPKPAAPQAPRRRKAFAPAIALILVIAIVTSLFVWPGFLKKDTVEATNRFGASLLLKKSDLDGKTTKITVGPEEYTVTDNGVTVDFGEYNDFLENKTLEIKDIGVKTDEEETLVAHLYDFTLEDQSEFFYPVTITLPCDGMEKPFVQYYNEDTKEWEFVPSVMDEYDDSVVFLTDHFSLFGLFESTSESAAKSIFLYANRAKEPETPTSKVYFNPAYTREIIDKCDADTKSLIASLKSDSGREKQFAKAMLESLGAASSASGGFDYTSKVIGYLSDIELPEGLEKSLSYAGAAFTSVKVGLSWYESGSLSKALKDNAFDLAELALSSAAEVYGSAPLTVCAGAAFLAGTANELGKEATKMLNGGYDNAVEHAYQDFAEEHIGYSFASKSFVPMDLDRIATMKTVELSSPRDAVLVSKTPSKIWGHVFKQAYLDNQGDPKKTMEAIDKKINEYAVVFWGLDGEIRKLVAEDIHRADAWKEPDKETKIQLRDACVEAMKSKMRLLYRGLFDRFMIKAQKDCEKQMTSVTSQLNKLISVTVVVEDEDGNEIPIGKSEYKDYIAAFINPQTGEPMEKWQWNPSDGDFSITLFNYGAVGAPTTVKLFESKNKLESNESEHSLFFHVKKDTEKVVLKLGESKEEKPDEPTQKPEKTEDGYDLSRVKTGEGYWRFRRIVENPDAPKERYGSSISGSNGSYTYTDKIIEESHCYYVCGHECQGEYISFKLTHSIPEKVYLGDDTVSLQMKGTVAGGSEYWCLTAFASLSANIRYRDPDTIWPSYGTDRYFESEDGVELRVGLTGDGLTNEHHQRKSYEFDTVVSGSFSPGSTPGETAYILIDAGTANAYEYLAYEYVWTIKE